MAVVVGIEVGDAGVDGNETEEDDAVMLWDRNSNVARIRYNCSKR